MEEDVEDQAWDGEDVQDVQDVATGRQAPASGRQAPASGRQAPIRPHQVPRPFVSMDQEMWRLGISTSIQDQDRLV